MQDQSENRDDDKLLEPRKPIEPSISDHNANDESARESSIPEEILEKLPREQRTELLQFFASMTSASMLPAGNPIYQKLTSQHIDGLISLQSAETKFEYEDRRDSRRIISLLLVIGIFSFIGFSVFLAIRDLQDLLQNLIQVAVAFAGGVGTGAGFQFWRRR